MDCRAASCRKRAKRARLCWRHYRQQLGGQPLSTGPAALTPWERHVEAMLRLQEAADAKDGAAFRRAKDCARKSAERLMLSRGWRPPERGCVQRSDAAAQILPPLGSPSRAASS